MQNTEEQLEELQEELSVTITSKKDLSESIRILNDEIDALNFENQN